MAQVIGCLCPKLCHTKATMSGSALLVRRDLATF
jgi:hypothetical protein